MTTIDIFRAVGRGRSRWSEGICELAMARGARDLWAWTGRADQHIDVSRGGEPMTALAHLTLCADEALSIPGSAHLHLDLVDGAVRISGVGTLLAGDICCITDVATTLLRAEADGAELVVWAQIEEHPLPHVPDLGGANFLGATRSSTA